jgi:N-acetylglutamate synthase
MIATALHQVAAPQAPSGSEPIPWPLASDCALEQMAATAWPALREIYSDGWQLRFSGGVTRRANCVLPLYSGHLDLEERIDGCEAAYARRGLPAVFKVWPHGDVTELVRSLDKRGYVPEANTSMMVCQLGDEPGTCAQPEIVTVDASEWVSAYASCCPLGTGASDLMCAMLTRIAPDHLLAVLRQRGRLLACGLGVCQDGYLGCFGIATAPNQRRRGHARNLLRQLLRWGRQRGAEQAYLQVQRANAAAAGLYRQLGFLSAYEYHYRIQPALHP